jgi:hypothetical protein
VGGTDWVAWHHVYDDPESKHSDRLRQVQAHLSEALDRQPAGEIRIVVPCAGQGRDLLGVLVDHPRRHEVVATLVELDPRNVGIARSAAAQLGESQVVVVCGDAGRTAAYEGGVPASIVVLSGFFDYLTTKDLRRLIASLPAFCADDATVLWARRTNAQRLLAPEIRAEFDAAGFVEVESAIPPSDRVHIGVERFTGTPRPLPADARIFTFRDPQQRWTVRRVRRMLGKQKLRVKRALGVGSS